MKRFQTKNIFLALCSFFFYLPIYSQNISSDTLSSVYAHSLFLEANAKQSRLNNGREYVPNQPYINGHPFFEAKEWATGDILYDGAAYRNVQMLYDLAKGEVLVLNFLLPDKLSLVTSKVKEFTIHGHHFIKLKAESLNQQSSGTFYDLLYRDGISVLAMRKKEIKVINNASLDASFNSITQYYLLRGEILYPVKTLSSVLKVLKDQKPAIQQYLKKSELVFRSDPEKTMVAIALFYDQLKD